MQALMLAAGMGKRLGKYTQNGTKCMVQVNGKALIEYAIEALVAAKIKKLVLVVGYRADILRAFLQGKYPQVEIIFVENPVYDKTNNIYSLYLAADYLAADDTILLESDLIFEKEIITEIIQSPEKNLAVVSKFESWMDGTVTLLNERNNIIALIEKAEFNWAQVESYYKTVNIYKFSRDFSNRYYLPFLEAYQKAFGQNEYYEQVLKALAFLDSTSISAYPVKGDRWYEIDDPQDLSIAENRFAKAGRKLALTQNRYGGYWRFPGMLDYCYLVNPYFPDENLKNELISNFTPLLTQYPSGLREQSLLAGKVFALNSENIITGNGAAELISAIGLYIKGSVAIPFPTFNEYPERFKGAKIIPIPVDAENFSYTKKNILELITSPEGSDVNCVLLINPDNPTGNFLPQKDVFVLLDEFKKRNITLIFDESFIDFAQKSLRYTLLTQEVLEKYKNLIVIKSISKSYGVPGLRLGILATGDIDLLGKLRKQVAIWNVNSFAEYFMQIFDKHKKSYQSACEKIADEREYFFENLKKIPFLDVFPSQANYFLCRIKKGTIRAARLAEILLEKYNVFIKDLSSKRGFETGEYIRLAVRSREDNNKLLDILGNFKDY